MIKKFFGLLDFTKHIERRNARMRERIEAMENPTLIMVGCRHPEDWVRHMAYREILKRKLHLRKKV